MAQQTINPSNTAITSRRTSEERPPRKWGNIASTTLLHILLLIGVVVMAGPFVWTVLTSLKDNAQAFHVPPVWLPNPVIWNNYPASLQALPFAQAYLNSAIVSVTIVVATLLTCSMAGYAFAKIQFPGRNILFFLFLATLMIPFQVTLIPLFFILRDLGLIDTLLALILPPALFNAFGVFLMRQFIMGIPNELEEAALVDGANRWTVYWRIVFPLLKAPLSALGILTFITQWNNFMMPLIMLNTPTNFTVPLVLNQFKGQFSTQWTQIMAGSVIAILPLILVYIILQRQIIRGIAMTGLKA